MMALQRGRRGASSLLVAVTATTAAVYLSRLDSSGHPTPGSITDACKLQYSHFHLLFTIPPLTVLYFLAAPFLTALDWHKLYILPAIAFVWTTPWDNELVRQKAWWYPTSCVLARIGYVPIEEYAFFILQSLMTTLLTILVTRWSTPRIGSSHHPLAGLLPLLPASMTLLGLWVLLQHTEGQGSLYYLAMITWWASVPLCLLWWGTAQSWAGLVGNGQVKAWLWCLAIPTLYLCNADLYALRRGTWHISVSGKALYIVCADTHALSAKQEKRSLEMFVVPELPVEEALFFLATNVILVSACFAFDRVVWQQRAQDVAQRGADSFAPLSPTLFALDWNTIQEGWLTFVRLDVQDKDMLQGRKLEKQREHALQILAKASKSFSIAATLLPWDLRVDLGCLYAFARAMDDFVDQPYPPSSMQKGDEDSQRMQVLFRLVKIAFATGELSDESVEEEMRSAVEGLNTANAALSKQAEQDLVQSALAASSLRGIVPERLWKELLDGYVADSALVGPHFTTFEEQADYAQNVAGSIGEMCVRVILARQGVLVSNEYVVPRDIGRETLVAPHTLSEAPLTSDQVTLTAHAPSVSLTRIARLLHDARRMGVSLQFINIARDVAKDATELHRCYLVTGTHDKADIRSALCSGHIDQLISDSDVDRHEEKEVADVLAPGSRIASEAIFAEKLYLLDVADAIYRSTVQTIDLLPCRPAQTGLRVACAVYAGIGDIIRRDGAQRCLERSRASRAQRLWIAIKAVYW